MKTPPTRISLAPLMLGCAVVVAVTTTIAHAQPACGYEVTIIQTPVDCGFGFDNTTGFGLNEHGAVVGYYGCSDWEHREAFVWTVEEGFITLERPQGVRSAIAVGVNDPGVICGTLIVSGLGDRGFVYDNGEWTILHPLIPDAGWSGAAAVNNAGVVVGYRSLTEDLNPRNAYIWSADKGFTDLGVMTGPSSFADSISETGIVVGWAGVPSEIIADAFIWQDEKLTLLGPVPGGFTSRPTAVTNEGVVLGRGLIDLKGFPIGAPRAFLWVDGVFEMLGVLPNHAWSTASDIQVARSVVVGASWNVDDNPSIAHGFIWRDGIMTNLNDLVSPDLEIVIRSAQAIVETGQILANGNAKHRPVAFLLTPRAAPLGDLNGDCQVGVTDLLMLLSNWGSCENCAACPADLDNNCVVGVSDLLTLLGNWG